jgi:hypothetical protein
MRADAVDWVVEHLPSKSETLRSNPSTAKNKWIINKWNLKRKKKKRKILQTLKWIINFTSWNIIVLFIFYFSLCSWVWPWTHDPLASISWVLRLQVFTIIPCLFLFIYLFLWYWGLNSGSTPWATLPVFFVLGFFEIGSHELLVCAGFKPWSFWSLPPE